MSDEFENDIEISNDILTLVDEDGQEHQFEVADTAEFEGCDYMALVPVYDDAQELLDDSGELVILRVMEEDGEEYLEAIEDEAEFNKVGDFFVARLEDIYDFEE